MTTKHSRLFSAEAEPLDLSRLLPSRILTIEEREAVASQIVNTVRTHDPVQLLSGLAYQDLFFHGPDTLPTFGEYLHHLILTHEPEKVTGVVDDELVKLTFENVKNLFASMSSEKEHTVGQDGEDGALGRALSSDSLYVRGKSYLVHQLDLLEGLHRVAGDWLLANMAISPGDLARTARWLFESLNSKANIAIAAVDDVEQRGYGVSFASALEYDIFNVSSDDAGISNVLRLLAAEPGSQPSGSSLLPGREWAASRDFPILESSKGLYCFNAQAVIDELPRLVGQWIQDRDPAYFDRKYVKGREQFVTAKTLECLSRSLPGAQSYQNLYYGNDSANRAETDGLLIYDDIAIIVEAKGKLLSFAARRGYSKRVERDFRELIDKAFSQAVRTATFLRSKGTAEFTDHKGNPVVTIDGRSFRKIYFVNPLFDGMDPLAIELADARRAGLLAAHMEWPWSVSINDLCVVTDILDSPTLFLLYMDRRLRFNVHSAWFRVHDELDLLDYFLHRGLFLEQKPAKNADFVQWQADTREMDRYYAARASGKELPPKPRPSLPPAIISFVSGIERSGVPGRIVLATEILALGAEIHRQIVDTLPLLLTRLTERHLPQSVALIRDGIGVSLWFTDTSTPRVREHLLFENRCNKHAHKAGEWLSATFVVQGAQPSLVEVIRDTTPWIEDPEMEQTVQDLLDAKFERRKAAVHPGRDDRCPCGSGKIFKRCHGK